MIRVYLSNTYRKRRHLKKVFSKIENLAKNFMTTCFRSEKVGDPFYQVANAYIKMRIHNFSKNRKPSYKKLVITRELEIYIGDLIIFRNTKNLLMSKYHTYD